MTIAAPRRHVGIDVGGTKCLGLALSPEGEHLGELRIPTPNDPDELIATLAHIAAELGAEESLGIGVPGLVNRDGVLLAAPNVTSVRTLALRARLEDACGLRVIVDNDNTVACLAEWKLGAGRGAHDMILVGIGTGIGGGAVCGGRLQRGAHGFAGEFGHIIVEHDGIECPCGQRGCWERYASGTGLGRWARKAASDGLLELNPADGDELRGEDVTRSALAGNHDALAVVDTFAGWVSLGLLSLTNVFDPEVIVLAGGISAAPELFLPPIERRFDARLYATELRPKPDIRFAELGPYAGAVGAALLTVEE